MHRFSIILLAAVAVVLPSCARNSGPPKKACYPAKGTLTVGGKPAGGAMITFHPDNSNPDEWAGGYPRAQVRADGSFDLETYGDKDGAPAGTYTVLVMWTQDADSEESEDTQMIDRLKGRYSTPETSKLKATVNEGPTELPPIALP